MAHIKKLVMNGFKSFGRKTEILFDNGINVIVGPNGSGKSNVSDALCFVLGRLSAKSMRASQARNMIFMGSKYVKPGKEAIVDLIFDNSDRAFGIDKDEIHLTRIIKRNGQGVYKINDETKTRTEILEMLAQAGIDPYGFNLILQGQIQSIVKMHPEERRKIIEEVAGISIYESRKEKSLHELEKTEEKLKEISITLRQRFSYLKNLEEERKNALKFKELELTVKRAKASILSKRAEEKNKEIHSIQKSVEENNSKRNKKQESADELRETIEKISERINQINKHIQQATGIEQSTLREQIAGLRAEIEGLRVRKENYENRRGEVERRIEEMKKTIPELEIEIRELKSESPKTAQRTEELRKKKDELAVIEEERKKAMNLKMELNNLRERVKDREKQLGRVLGESESNLRNLEEYSRNLKYKDEKECSESLESLKKSLNDGRNKVNELNKRELEQEKIVSVSESEIERAFKIKNQVEKLDICPLCQSKITAEHISHVVRDSESKMKISEENLGKAKHELESLRGERRKIIEDIKSVEEKKSMAEMEIVRHRTINEKKEYLKKLLQDEKNLKQEIQILEDKRKTLEAKTSDSSRNDERYDNILLEIEEISSRNEENVDSTILVKERDLENSRNVIKRNTKDLEEVGFEIKELSARFSERAKMLQKKEEQERELNERFKKLFDERDSSQSEFQKKNIELSEANNEVRQVEDQTNYLKIGMAKLGGELDGISMELSEFAGLELIQGSVNMLEEKMKKSQESLMQIGSINMRALEVYDEIKKEYDLVQDKANILDKEKLEILNIIAEIDRKKKTSFMKSFREINDRFTRNFSQLYTKGIAYLEIENKEDIFAGGVNIVVKLAKGKYFDVTSLSGGEQTLVALSLLFAIQEYKPYHFYVFDEIDAALDKRNSERLAGLLNQYMKSGQYIVITHNDALIMNSNVLYGVSMHDGVSKILSLKLQ